MAKNWYPVIDITAYAECGKCVEKCGHGVYDKAKTPVPVVVYPEGCVDHCHGCGNLCPNGAITYVGEDTDWTPPALEEKPTAKTGCGCGGAAENDTPSKRKLRIEYLYLDLQCCDRCIGTDIVLEEVIEGLRPALELAGYAVEYRKIEMTTARLAEKYGFLSSPTILVNGVDIFGTIRESDCGCCGEIAGTEVDCRVFEYEGRLYEVPTEEMLARAILKNLDARPSRCRGPYKLPENLRRFYEGKAKKAGKKSACGCGCSRGK